MNEGITARALRGAIKARTDVSFWVRKWRDGEIWVGSNDRFGVDANELEQVLQRLGYVTNRVNLYVVGVTKP